MRTFFWRITKERQCREKKICRTKRAERNKKYPDKKNWEQLFIVDQKFFFVPDFLEIDNNNNTCQSTERRSLKIPKFDFRHRSSNAHWFTRFETFRADCLSNFQTMSLSYMRNFDSSRQSDRIEHIENVEEIFVIHWSHNIRMKLQGK